MGTTVLEVWSNKYFIYLGPVYKFLRRVLIKSKQPHPYIYLKGILPQDLEAIVDYLYNGETKVGADDVDRFIEAATELQIDGLMAQDVSGRIQEEDQHPKEESEFVFEHPHILVRRWKKAGISY